MGGRAHRQILSDCAARRELRRTDYNFTHADRNRPPRAHLPLCESLNYREWSGYYTVSAYESHHEHEYNAIRNASALIDVSPLFKYMVTGPDAARLVDRLITRDVSKMAVGTGLSTRRGATSTAR